MHNRKHALPHGRHKELGPALWVAGVLVALFVGSLVAIVLYLHYLAQLLLEIAGYAWPAP
jgi:hypothetical protein